MRHLFAGLLALVMPALAPAQDADHYSIPGYDANANRVPAPNLGATKFAPNGACDGMSQTEKFWWHARQNNPSLPPLAEFLNHAASGQGMKADAERYLQDLSGLLQRVAEERRPRGGFDRILIEAGTYVPPFVRKEEPGQNVLSQVKNEFGKAPRDLVGLELYRKADATHPGAAYHRVNVSGYQPTDNGFALRISDPNTPPGAPMAQSLILHYDQKRNLWEMRSFAGTVVDSAGRPLTYTNAGVVHDPSTDPRMWRMLDMARRGEPIRDIQDAVGFPSERTLRERYDQGVRDGNTRANNFVDWMKQKTGKAVSATVDKVNGVTIRYDPLLFEGAVTERELDGLVQEMSRFLKDTEEGTFYLSLVERRERLHLVSVRRLVEANATTLGKLTRLRGYVQDGDGNLFLVGLVEESKEPIPLDLFLVALRRVWKEGLAPFISLDPDPLNFKAPHKVRIGSMPAELRNTAFVRTLLEADYAMKALTLGKEQPRIAGFKSLPDLMRAERDAPASVMARFWLSPKPIPVAGLMETRRDKATAVLFESEVEILTESMKQAGELLLGTGDPDPIAEEEARLLTHFYPELETVNPAFHRLHTIFDLTKLCALWRSRGISDSALEALVKRKPAEVAVPATYEAIALQSGNIQAVGGAKTRHRIATKAVVATDKLVPLLDAAGKVPPGGDLEVGDVTLPRSLEYRGAASAPFNAELQLSAVRQFLSDGRFEDALQRLNFVVQLDPGDSDAIALRAALLVYFRRYQDALADVERALPDMPQLLALRGCVRACTGDEAGARRDADQSSQKFADDPTVAVWNLATRMELFDLDGTDAELNRLSILMPADPLVQVCRGQVTTFRRLGPEKAKERQRQIREVPSAITASVMRGASLLHSKPGEAIPILEKALALCQDSSVPVVKELAIGERCQFLLALAHATQGVGAGPIPEKSAERAVAYTDQLIKAHPERASGYLGRSLVKAITKAPSPETLAAYDEAIKRAGAKDPVLDELAIDVGSDRMVAWFGRGLWLALLESGDSGREILDRLIAQLGSSPDVEFLTILRDQPDLNLAKAMEAARRPGFDPRDQEREAMLRSLRAVVDRFPDRPVTEPAALGILLTFWKTYMLLDLDHRTWERLLPVYVKCLRETRASNPPEALRKELTDLRGKVTLLLEAAANSALTARMEKDGLMEAIFKKRSAAIDKAAQAKDVDAVKQNVRELTQEFRRLIDSARAATREQIAYLQRETDPFTAPLLELMLANMQKQFSRQSSPFDKLATQFPELKGSAEWMELEEIQKEVPAHLWVTRDLDAIWPDVLANVNNRVDAAVVLEVLKEWENFGRGMSGRNEASDLIRMQKELEQRISTSRFGKESLAPPDEPAPQSSSPPRKAAAALPERTWLLLTAIGGSAAALLVIAFCVRARARWK